MNKFTAIFIFNKEDGWWTATCAEIPAAITQGKTKEEARENLADAIELVLDTERELALKNAGADANLEEIQVTAS